MRSSVRLLVYAQLSLWVFLFVCFLFIPNFLLQSDEGGISNYGVYARTIVPYTLAFGMCGLLTLQAARVLPEYTVKRKTLWSILTIFGWLCLLVLETTYLYQVGGLIDDAHVFAGILFLVFETGSTLWLWKVYFRDIVQGIVLSVQIVGFILAALTYAGVLHVLFVAEIASSLSYGVLLIRSVKRAV